MLEMGTLELVDHPYPGYYSQLFLVQNVLVGWGRGEGLASCDQLVKSERICYHHQVQDKGDHFVVELIRKEDFMFSMNLKDTCLQIPIHPTS